MTDRRLAPRRVGAISRRHSLPTGPMGLRGRKQCLRSPRGRVGRRRDYIQRAGTCRPVLLFMEPDCNLSRIITCGNPISSGCIYNSMESQAPRRRLIMHYNSWNTWRKGERFQWEGTGRVRVCPIDADTYSDSAVLGSVKTILAEFNLPLEVDTATLPTLQKVRDLMAKSSNAETIHYYDFFNNLNECREQKSDLQAALIVVFDGEQYRLYDYDRSNTPHETPEWGCADEDGVILLRLVSGQPLASLVRHEMGHLLGIGRHHRGCAMDWASCEDRFCNECLKTIQQTCEVITLPD